MGVFGIGTTVKKVAKFQIPVLIFGERSWKVMQRGIRQVSAHLQWKGGKYSLIWTCRIESDTERVLIYLRKIRNSKLTKTGVVNLLNSLNNRQRKKPIGEERHSQSFALPGRSYSLDRTRIHREKIEESPLP